jgi:hypothetical protein
MKFAAAMFSSLLIVAAIPSAPLDDACNKCQPAAAAWDWKANGYALGADAASAQDGAKQDSIASGCKTAAKYIEGRWLRRRRARRNLRREPSAELPARQLHQRQGHVDLRVPQGPTESTAAEAERRSRL